MFFDTHAHYDDESFDTDRDKILSELPNQGVSLVLNPGCDLETSLKAIEIAENHPHVYAAVGVHPTESGKLAVEELIPQLEKLTEHPKVKAVGEIGLDYYWEDNPTPEIQSEIMHAQMELAKKVKLPVIIHDREAHNPCFEVVSQYDVNGVYHCYSGSTDYAKKIIDKGWMLSFTGVVTYKNAKKTLEVLKYVPIEHIMIETDSPYLTPIPHRGKRNFSGYLPLIAQVIADIKGISLEECANITTNNGKQFFQIT